MERTSRTRRCRTWSSLRNGPYSTSTSSTSLRQLLAGAEVSPGAEAGVVGQLTVRLGQQVRTAVFGWCLGPTPRSSQQADPGNPTGHARQQGGRGRGRRAPRTPFAGNPQQMAPVVQTGFQPARAAEEPVGQPNRRSRDRYQERRGRSTGQRGRGSLSAPQRNSLSDRREGEQHDRKSNSHQHSAGSRPAGASAPAPAIQFGQFAAGSFNID